MRIAIAHTGKSKDVAQYLPNNFQVLGRTLDNTGTIIVGVDDHGWSLDAYVIPRLGSALISCEEVFEINGLCITQLELNLTNARKAEEKYHPTEKKRGRKPVLTHESVSMVRHLWRVNDNDWQRYRANPNSNPKPHHLTVADLAKRFRVSEGVIADVINETGAYKS
jgi:hypothetical protein